MSTGADNQFKIELGYPIYRRIPHPYGGLILAGLDEQNHLCLIIGVMTHRLKRSVQVIVRSQI